MKKTNLYRIIAMMLALMMLCIAFVGCKKENTDTESEQGSNAAISTDNNSSNDTISDESGISEDASFDASGETTDTESSEAVESSDIDASSDVSDETTDAEISESSESSDIDTSSDVSTDVSNDTSDESSEPIVSEPETSDPVEHTHDFKVVKVKEATCTMGGATYYECDCGEEKREATVALGHKDGEWVVIVEATTDHNGTKYLYCARCDEKINEKSIPKLEDDTNDNNSSESGTHTHGTQAIVVDPTCTEEGYTYIECVPCGIYSKYNVVDALGHKKTSPWVTVKEATESEDGLKEQHCERCGVLMGSEVIPKLDKYSVIATEENTALVEERVLYYINQYRVSEGACEMSMLQNKARAFARRRAEQLVTNYGHDEMDARAAATEFEYGIYVPERPETIYDWETDTIIETGNITPAYYSPYGGEAIGSFVNMRNTVDKLSVSIARSFFESKAHWEYIGSDVNPYVAIGVEIIDNKCFVCIITSDVDTYDKN